jgi:hypothetical protein
MDTKYFTRVTETIKTRWKYVELNRSNWWYVQLDATIRTIFRKYGFDYPEYVFVDKVFPRVDITVMRGRLTDEDAAKWVDSYRFIVDELKAQADANSTSEYDEVEDDCRIYYNFKVI